MEDKYRENFTSGNGNGSAGQGTDAGMHGNGGHTDMSGAGESGSTYSYSYRNQENQERNPNYYEKKEAEQATPARASMGSGENAGASYGGSGSGQAYGGQASGGQSYGGSPYGSAGNGGWAYGGSGNGPRDSYGQPAGGGWKSSSSQQGAYSQPYGGQASGGQWDEAPGKGKKRRKQKAPREKKQHGFGMKLVKCAALALVFGLVSSTVFYGTGLVFKKADPSSTQQEGTVASGGQGGSSSGDLSTTAVSTATTVTDVSDIVDNVMPSIVSITNMGQEVWGDFFGRTYSQDTESAGSGIIISQTEDEIFIATNNHVVANSTQLTVNFIDDQIVEAEIKGTDSSMDLAVLSVKVKDIPKETMDKIKVATLGNSDEIKVGQSAVAIGNALGYGQSVTTGVISAMDREVTVSDEMTGTSVTNDLIQTDAAINPGNSGGALLNMNGEVIGINSVKYSDTEVEGMGYAIPISAAEPIINNLITREVVDESKSSYLGVSGQDVTSDLAKNFGMPEGLYITKVEENSAAAQAGIKKGDVITKFDGKAVKGMESLAETMQYYSAGTQVEITIQTNENGEWVEKTVSAVLGKKNG